MARRLLSIVIALVATVLGYLAAWTGGVSLANEANSFRGGFNAGWLLLVLLGLLLLAVAALTVAISSAGVILVGAIHLAFGVLAFALPMTGLDGGFSPAYMLMQSLFSTFGPLGGGLFFSVPTGFGMLVGVVTLLGGLAARSRVARAGTTSRVVSGIVALVIAVPAVLLLLVGGGDSYRRAVVMFQPATPLDLVAIVAGLILVAVVVLSVRWSSTGLVLLGVIVSALGAVFLLATVPVAVMANGLSQELAAGIQSAGATGNVLIAGVVMLGVAIGVRVRARRAVLAKPTADVQADASV